MFDFLARLLNVQRPWLSEHPNARQVRKQHHPSGCYEIAYRDDRTGETATYHTDDLGNVQYMDVVAR